MARGHDMIAYGQGVRPILRPLAVALIAASLAACTSIYRNHGYVPNEQDLAALKVGVDTRDSVIEAVGAPGSSGVLETGGFYYVASRMRHYGPRQPEVVSRQLVAISFDQRGVVSNVERYGLEDGKFIPLERRVTNSSVEDKTFLRQLLGNIGNIGPGGLPN